MTLQTSRLIIRKLLESDLAAVFACYDHPDVGRYCAPVRWPDMDYALKWFNRRAGDVATGAAEQFVIEAKDTGKVIGTSVLFTIDNVHRNAEIGYGLGRDFWGAGYANEAVTAVINHAFADLKLHRLNAQVDSRNFASAHVLLRLGFTQEGISRQSYIDAGEFTDSMQFGLLVHEWKHPPVGAGHTPS